MVHYIQENHSSKISLAEMADSENLTVTMFHNL
jgi:hypothetical protein